MMEKLTMVEVATLIRLVEHQIDANLESKKMADHMFELSKKIGIIGEDSEDLKDALHKGHKLADNTRLKYENIRVKLHLLKNDLLQETGKEGVPM